MEIEWRRRQWQGYLREAEAAGRRWAAGERSPVFLRRVVQLLYTYFHSPRAESEALAPTTPLVQLALTVYAYTNHLGEWEHIADVLDAAAATLKGSPQQITYIDLVKALAITLTNLGQHTQAQELFDEVIEHDKFARLPVTAQVDMLVHAGTCHVWHGDRRRAQTLLERAVRISVEAGAHPVYRTRADANGVYSFALAARLWESTAYAFNQLGCLALFDGRFAEAEALYRQCHDLLVTHDGADNLACVAYQALGRLRLYQGRYAEAAPILARGLAVRRRRQEKPNTALNAIYLAGAHLGQGDLPAAEALLCEAMTILCTLETAETTILCHLYFGELEIRRGNDRAVFDHWRQALVLLRTQETPLVELRVWIIYLPWLLRKGEWSLGAAICRQLVRSSWRRGLGPRALWRLVSQLWFRPKAEQWDRGARGRYKTLE
jgi:tetratricopeptide (TPR) repeat protein